MGRMGVCGLEHELRARGPARFLQMGDSTDGTEKKEKEITYNKILGDGRPWMRSGSDKKCPKCNQQYVFIFQTQILNWQPSIAIPYLLPYFL